MEYWHDEELSSKALESGFNLEYRGVLMIKLIEHFGSVAGTPMGEDSSGRSILGLQPPAELVQRCAEIADLAIAELERRIWIRRPEAKTPEQLMERAGELERIKLDASYARTKV